jgi:hypothetical protein
MAEVQHSERAHALLSASGAKRWLNCTPSPRLEENFAEGAESPFAKEGTLAHEFGDIALQKYTKKITLPKYRKLVAVLRKNEYYTDEMEDQVEKYTTYVIEQFKAAKRITKDALLLVEDKVDLTSYIEDGFGTNDSTIIADRTLEVGDLKYGKGIRVDAEDNDQLKLYGLGALMAYDLMYDIKDVRLTIIQPRLDHISSWVISAEDLIKWGEEVVIPKAREAYAGAGEQCVGDWCRWCKVKPKCRALAEQSLEMAKHDFADPRLLTDTEIIENYRKIPQLQEWAKSVSEYVLTEALGGKPWEGYKLVEGRSNRKWSDTEMVVRKLQEEAYADDEILNTSLKGIGDIEKLLTKPIFADLLGLMVNKPQGKPTLVSETDKRPAMGIESAKSDFK